MKIDKSPSFRPIIKPGCFRSEESFGNMIFKTKFKCNELKM